MNIKKILTIILLIITIFCLMIFVVGMGVLFGKLEEYTYLKINKKNKDIVVNLIKEQEKNMFLIDGTIELEDCYKNIRKVEVIYRFPDGEDYTLYCGKDKFEFSLDNSNYDLPNFIGKNGKFWYKIK